MRSNQLKLAAASIGGAAAVTMGIVGLVSAESPSTEGNFGKGPEITLGETTTEEAAPTELATTFVTPPVTAEPPDGFGNGDG